MQMPFSLKLMCSHMETTQIMNEFIMPCTAQFFYSWRKLRSSSRSVPLYPLYEMLKPYGADTYENIPSGSIARSVRE